MTEFLSIMRENARRCPLVTLRLSKYCIVSLFNEKNETKNNVVFYIYYTTRNQLIK